MFDKSPLFMQNKPNFRNDKMNITLDMTRNYKILYRSPGQKTKPIQTQFKPIQTQLKPIKAKTNPIQTHSHLPSKGIEPKSDAECLKTTCLWQLQFKPVFCIIIGLLDDKLLKS